MDTILRALAEHLETTLAMLVIGWLVLLLALYILGKKFTDSQKRWHELLRDSRGSNLETLLYDHLHERTALEDRVEQLSDRVADLETRARKNKRHIGLVSYDAFPDVGGSQSFALALYDDSGNGCVVTSLVGRADCRVYCKQLTSGRSDRTLSPEEERAVLAAQKGH
jgi:uncharacterized protein YlxW (UPF0749 family)